MANDIIDVREADSNYKSYPSFEDWRLSGVDNARWKRYSELITSRSNLSLSLLKSAQNIVKRAAAIDTGAIEGLYEVDRGFTFTVATEAAMWETALNGKGDKVRSLIESQLEAYDLVLDAATNNIEISESFIRRLHEVLCKGQITYSVMTEIGPQEQELPLGVYKHLPNHVRKQDGTIHSYCPVDLVPAEMHRLCEVLRSDMFKDEHPVLQSSFAHYAFVIIHPFADGNGRVARALASIFSYRAASIPLLILSDNRRDYFTALEATDKGERQQFVDFILERGLDAFRLVNESLEAATYPPVETVAAEIKRLYFTRGGYTHDQVDQAGFSLMNIFLKELSEQMNQLKSENISLSTADMKGHKFQTVRDSLRLPVSNGLSCFSLQLQTPLPANAVVRKTFQLEIPKDCGYEDDIVIHLVETPKVFEARVTELIPTPTTSFGMRISIAASRFLSEILSELKAVATDQLGQSGYSRL